MSQADIFSIEKHTIDIDGIDNLLKFARYNPDDSKIFLGELELARDLETSSGTTLFKKGTLILYARIAQLINFKELNPDLHFSFRIKRNEKLLNRLGEVLAQRMAESLKQQQRTKVFHNLLSGISNEFESLRDEILAEEDITLAIYKMWSICESSKKSSTKFISHSIDTALFSLAMASSKQYAAIVEMDREKSLGIIKTCLFLNYGALTKIDTILNSPADMKVKQYWDANINGCTALGNLQLDCDIMDSIRLVCEYYLGRKDFIQDSGWPATMTNIILVAEAFLQKANGLFEEPIPVKQATDELNLRAFEKDVSEVAVEALTLGLDLAEIFDFYREMDRLIKKCSYGSAHPYPLSGLRSPTIFVCKNNVMECDELEQSVQAVHLVKQLGELSPNVYRRCLMLTDDLLAFYQYHYKQIKDTIAEEADSE